MALKFTPQEKLEMLLDDNDSDAIHLTEWEHDFCTDVLELIRKGGTLTERQEEVIKDLYDRY